MSPTTKQPFRESKPDTAENTKRIKKRKNKKGSAAAYWKQTHSGLSR
jgi:hypothetical protein